MSDLALVTGASGLLGGNLLIHLLSKGIRVRGLFRTENSIAHLQAFPIEWVRGEVNDRQSMDQACKGVDVVFHCAARVGFGPLSRAEADLVNVEGTRHVADAALSAKVGRLVHCSSVAALGLLGDRHLANEDTTYNWAETALENEYSRTKHEAQELILRMVREKGLDAVVVNPGTMFGAYDSKPSSGAIIVAIAKKQALASPSGRNCFVSVTDVAEGMFLAWKKGQSGECYILGGENLGYHEFFSRVARLAGVAPPRFILPDFVARLGGLVGDLGSFLTRHEAGVTSSTVKVACVNHCFDSAKAQERLGYHYGPVDGGITQALEWFRQTGRL